MSEDSEGSGRGSVEPRPPPGARALPTAEPNTSEPTGRGSAAAGGGFDVFLSHHSVDRPAVRRLAERLRARRLRPWLDVWMLVPGADWQDGLAAGLRESSSCAVLLGAGDLGAWQRPEVHVALDWAMRDADFRVLLVLLPGVPDPFDPTSIGPFLSMRTWVDLRKGVDDLAGVDRLIRAVQGMPIESVPQLAGGRDVCPIAACCRSARPTTPGSSDVMVTSSVWSRS